MSVARNNEGKLRVDMNVFKNSLEANDLDYPVTYR